MSSQSSSSSSRIAVIRSRIDSRLSLSWRRQRAATVLFVVRIGSDCAKAALRSRRRRNRCLEKGIACACLDLLYVRKHLVFVLLRREYITCETISASQSMRMTANHATFFQEALSSMKGTFTFFTSKKNTEFNNGRDRIAILRSARRTKTHKDTGRD
jgi:hypothetical protein